MKSNTVSKQGKTSRLQELPLSRLFPNMVTILSLCAGLSAIRFGLKAEWELAVIALIIASFIDGMDGRLARLLNSTSTFGAHLDSLSDFLSFGVAPGLVLYLWVGQEIKGLGWALVLLFAVCMAIRLARFNTSLDDEEKAEWEEHFFIGIPAPAGALLAVVPMMVTFQFGSGIMDSPIIVILYATCIAFLVVSHIPTYSMKRIHINKKYSSLVLVIVGVLITGMIIEPWITFPLIGIGYFLMMPFSINHYFQLEKKHNYDSD